MYQLQKKENSTGVKLKNIQLSFIVLASLIILSFAFFVSAQNNSETSNNIFTDSDQDGLSDQEEKIYGTDPHDKDTDNDSYTDSIEVQSGYDPLKPAPGDKIIAENKSNQTSSAESGKNMTKKLAYQITQLAQNPDSKESINSETIQSLVGQTIPEDQVFGVGGNTSEEPLFSAKDFKIKKQNYGNLSQEKAEEKRKADFVEYSAAIIYIFFSNSSQPLTSESSGMGALINSMSQKVINAFSSRDPKQVESIAESGEKMLEQIKEITVPEELVDMHIQALTFAAYAKDMQKYISPNMTDPIADIQNLSKVIGLISNASSLFSQMEAKSTEYNLLNEPQLITDKIKELQKNGAGE